MNDTVLIVGASSDVGIELIKGLNTSAENTIIIAHYNSSMEGLLQIDMINGNELIPLQCDFRNMDALQRFIAEVKKIGVPKGIVHLPAPKLDYIRFKNIEWEDCENDIRVQVKSAFLILQELLPLMVKKPQMSKVVFMLSENTINLPAKFSTKYTMSKYMLLGLMKSLTSEYEGKKVNINALSPTIIDTKLLSNIDRRMLEVNNVIDGMLEARDVVDEILMLLSAKSDGLFGENILIQKGLRG